MECPKVKQRRGRHVVSNKDDSYIYICSCGCEFESWTEGTYYIVNECDHPEGNIEFKLIRAKRRWSDTIETLASIVFLLMAVLVLAGMGFLAVKVLMLRAVTGQ